MNIRSAIRPSLPVWVLLLSGLLTAAHISSASTPSAVTVNPTAIKFGNQAINTKSAGKAVTVTNNQTVPLTITSISLNLSDFTDTTTCPISPKTLVAGASCTVTVFFTPSVTQLRTASLAILTNAGNPIVNLSGTGVVAVAVSPASLTFGSQKTGTFSASQTVTLTNNLSTPLSITGVSSSLSDYFVSTTCPIKPNTLAPAASCTASVKFKPSVTGTRTGTLSFSDNDTSSPQQVSMVGTGATGTLVSIAVTPSAASVALGTSEQFTATATYSDNSTQNVTPSSIWTSSSPAVATVSAGMASTLAQGATTVSASSGTISGSASLTVTAPALVSIAVTPANPTISVGMSQQMTATGTYTDNSTQDLTGSSTWSSNATSVATVSTTGLASGVSAGNATLQATLGSVSGSTQVNVTPSTVAYYVSPTGNDSNPGTLDLPLATAQKAESLVVANYLGTHCASQKAPIIVQFRGGTWSNFALKLTSADSGCSSSAPVVFENYPGETPVFSGGVRVQNWVNTSGSTWQTTLPAGTLNFEALYYNGIRRQRPRLGSSTSQVLGSYYRVAGNVTNQYDRFYYNSSDPITTTWKNYAPATGNPCGQQPGPTNLQGDIQIGIFEKWDISWQRISCIDTTNHLIYLTGSTASGTAHGYLLNHRYVVENIQDSLTVPGQWFLDRSVTGAWVLTYIANAGENPNNDTVIIPQQPQVLTAAGVQYRTFFGITFANDNFVVSPTGYQGSQSELAVPAAVQCTNCSYVTFDSNSFSNIEGYGLGFPTDNTATATGDVVQDNAFWDLGAGGLMTGRIPTGPETDANVFQFATIQNNLVQGFGRRFAGAAGIANLLSHDVVTSHNDVTDGYNEGIMICFPSFTNNCQGSSNSGGGFNHLVQYNHIWNLGQGLLNDFGGVYMATYNAVGDVVSNNKLHDYSDASSQDSDGYGGNGFYIDRGGPIQITNNLVYRTVNAFNVTMGPPSISQVIDAKNNIFAYTRKSVINTFACDKDGYSQFAALNNIFLQDRTSASSPSSNLQSGSTYLGNPISSGQNFSSNDYWNTAETFSTDTKAFNAENSACQAKTYYTFSAWQALGEDIGSLSVNPEFTAAAYPNDDYSFASGPPNIGFVPFSTTGTCPSCPGRNNPVINPAPVPAGFPTVPFNPATDY